ncbi:MAG TPA: hypothetical protein VLJ80_05230 [Solirubrobacteraceae bacterium]|nr:hypothetical protein [Solirubrobacteraceae bacterium]
MSANNGAIILDRAAKPRGAPGVVPDAPQAIQDRPAALDNPARGIGAAV